MEQPRFANIVHIIAIIGAVIGVLFSLVLFVGAFQALEVNAGMGLMALISAVATLLGSLAGLGIVNCFLAMVKAQIETRNAIVRMAQQGQQVPSRS